MKKLRFTSSKLLLSKSFTRSKIKNFNCRFENIGSLWESVNFQDLTVRLQDFNSHQTSWQFFAKEVKSRLPRHKHPWILKTPLRTPPRIKFCIFWCCKRKPEMKFWKFRTPEMGRKRIFAWFEWYWFDIKNYPRILDTILHALCAWHQYPWPFLASAYRWR